MNIQNLNRIILFVSSRKIIPTLFLSTYISLSVMEGDEVSNGWPLGLGNINSKITAADAPQLVAPPQPYAARRSSSFSSFYSSDLDTESNGSFFPDQSVSLGRLIGMRPVTKGSFYSCRQQRRISDGRSHPNVQEDKEIVQGLCVPLLHHVMGMMGKSGSCKRQ